MLPIWPQVTLIPQGVSSATNAPWATGAPSATNTPRATGAPSATNAPRVTGAPSAFSPMVRLLLQMLHGQLLPQQGATVATKTYSVSRCYSCY